MFSGIRNESLAGKISFKGSCCKGHDSHLRNAHSHLVVAKHTRVLRRARSVTCAMNMRTVCGTVDQRCTVSLQRPPNFVRHSRWPARRISGATRGTGCSHVTKACASPWTPTPYQWAPLPQPSPEETLRREDFSKFVQFFRQASPYIEGHRGRTFVIVIPGEVMIDLQLTQTRQSASLQP